MILYPAIDIQGGKVVRLMQGKFDEVTHYGDDPLATAERWVELGATWLHLVDLDGAKTGSIQNMDAILRVAQAVSVPVQMGGGIRTKDDIAQLIEGGVSRVILGTKVVEDTTFLLDMLSAWNDKIAVSLDCVDGKVTRHGWTSTSDIKAVDFAKELELLGLKCLIYTDVARDGMLTGPNYEGLKALLDATDIPVIASGGIADIEDIKKLKSLEARGVMGAITGKAIYEGRLDLKEALALC